MQKHKSNAILIFSLYSITNIVNGKIYIGQTTNQNPIMRWKNHIAQAISDKKLNTAIANAIRKYKDTNSLKFEIIAQCKSIEDLNYLEIELIKQYNSLVPIGYNISVGGKNQPLTQEVKDKISKSHFGIRPNEQTRLKMSEKAKLRPSPMKGKYLTEDQKNHLSEINKLFPKEISLDISEKYKNGKKIKYLAKEYNCSAGAIKTALKTTDTSRRLKGWELAEENIKNVINYYLNDKMKLKEIAKIYKCDASDIGNLLKLNNIKLRQSAGGRIKLSEYKVKEIQDKAKNGVSTKSLAKEYGRGLTTIRTILNGEY